MADLIPLRAGRNILAHLDSLQVNLNVNNIFVYWGKVGHLIDSYEWNSQVRSELTKFTTNFTNRLSMVCEMHCKYKNSPGAHSENSSVNRINANKVCHFTMDSCSVFLSLHYSTGLSRAVEIKPVRHASNHNSQISMK